ncbi:hypothetical protein CHX26_08360 [Porphyrobacter sp. HT-58-2]|uniref:hypothetical protein n=1 Tax=Porphyrobacter sp. HT-58-2 TaxID=2023229 RepID=UPI000CDBD9D3|nr:hypothetical protein [Porphyrobacter sp. HT-58-2]AUX69500.1 hypothetical protein CHX26_08360 [Porphyrobacter sp. HT-58-2]
MTKLTTVRLRAAAVLAGLALVLSGCFMSPGKFTSEMVLTGPDSFTFSYDGEIFFLGLSKLAQMDNAEESFTPSTCYDDETFEERDCTKAELDEQRADWDAGAADRAAEAKKKAKQMAAMMGGIDPSDPKAAEELVKLLQRQKGWERVVHKGDGLFHVSFRVKGTLGHDFMFPLIEGFPATNPFVQTFGRKNGQLRINAPGFTAQGSDNAMSGMMGGLGAIAGMGPGATDGEAVPGLPQLDGTFTIRTAQGMRILANNTDDGPEATTTGEALSWRITPRTAQFPTALIAAAP